MDLPTKTQITDLIAMIDRRKELFVEQHKNDGAINDALDNFETGRYLVPGMDQILVINVKNKDAIRVLDITVIDDDQDGDK